MYVFGSLLVVYCYAWKKNYAVHFLVKIPIFLDEGGTMDKRKGSSDTIRAKMPNFIS